MKYIYPCIKTVHEGIKDHSCEYCEKCYSQPADLKRHIKAVHEGVKEYKCDTCGKHFTRADNLRTHVKTVHEGIKVRRSAPAIKFM